MQPTPSVRHLDDRSLPQPRRECDGKHGVLNRDSLTPCLVLSFRGSGF